MRNDHIEKFYTVHGIVNFKIIHEKKFKWKFNKIHEQYENFKIKNVDKDDIDFVVYLGNFVPENNECLIIDDNFYIKKDYFYCKKDTYKFTKWQFEISGFESKRANIKISSNFMGYRSMVGFIIDYMIFYKLNEKGFSMIHASGISKENKGNIFAARGGAGKTTIALNLMEENFNFLGDNFVLLKKGKVMSFLTPLSIFTYNLSKNVSGTLTFKDKLNFEFKKIIYKITGGYIKIFTKVNVKNIFKDKIVNKTNLENIFVLVPHDEFKLEKIDKDELINYLVLNQKMDLINFMKYIIEYSYIFPESRFAKQWILYKQNLKDNLCLSNDLNIYKLEIPKDNTYLTNKIKEII
ncbi:hypothetical protein [Methanobacterium oryzae]|uniref:hypothetical protein n=1 Tax=Methanobacterium oryzae TaxID=69540 RepID=UPI003D2056B7